MRALALFLWIFSAAALAQVPAEKARLQQKKEVAPRLERKAVPQDGRTTNAIKGEQRRMDAASKASKERHKAAPNAIRNER